MTIFFGNYLTQWGKTTVALHRISYVLYNYEEKYKPSEFCIIGSSDMLLNYISSGLPELDVNHVRQMRMDLFLPYLMGKSLKKKYQVIPEDNMAPVKSKLDFVNALEEFLDIWKQHTLILDTIKDSELGILLSEANMKETRDRNPQLSLLQLEKLLNTRIASRIKFLCTGKEENEKKRKLQEYRNYFHSAKNKWTEPQIYREFLLWLMKNNRLNNNDWEETLCHVKKGRFDLYDTAALCLIWKRILKKKDADEFSQIIIDEAQDFGVMIYYVMKQVLDTCYFTIMGDVSQNIRYETGMNDWEDLKKVLFQKEQDSFYLLAKSYRNTIEISECAGKVLEKASQGSYKIQPVIRHGQEVQVNIQEREALNQLLKATVAKVQEQGFETIAVVCREEEEAKEVRKILGIQEENQDFHNGVMVLPVTLTKGLEFDAVILWKADEKHYGENPKEARQFLEQESIDLLVSDISLPDGSGMEFCREARAKSELYIIFLSALDQEVDIVNGYDCGADDYMTKPFSLLVLISKVNAFMRRAVKQEGQILVSKDIQVHCNTMQVYEKGEPVILSKKELQLLIYLMENAGRIVTKEQILEHVWDMEGQFVEENTVTVTRKSADGMKRQALSL